MSEIDTPNCVLCKKPQTLISDKVDRSGTKGTRIFRCHDCNIYDHEKTYKIAKI